MDFKKEPLPKNVMSNTTHRLMSLFQQDNLSLDTAAEFVHLPSWALLSHLTVCLNKDNNLQFLP